MKFSVLHLSDIHFKTSDQSLLPIMGTIHNAIRNTMVDMHTLLIVFSGDVAYSGRTEEYSLAMELLDTLIADLKTYFSNLEIIPIFIPGNHDCDFSSDNVEVRDIVIKSLHTGSASITEKLIATCCTVQSNFNDFRAMYEPKDSVQYSDDLLRVYNIKIGNYCIILNCLNTSWISELHEQPGRLLFPIERYKNIFQSIKGDLVISTLHHPMNWFRPDSARSLKRVLEHNSDIILSGHEHVSDFAKKSNIEMATVEYIEGGALNEHGHTGQREFNLIQFKLDEHLHNTSSYRFQDGLFLEYSSTNWIAIGRERMKRQFGYRINEQFEVYLSDPGAALTHPRKAELFLEDIFVYPDAKIIVVDDKSNESIQYVSLNELTKMNSEENRSFVFGDEDSGKTTLCKMLFKHYYSLGYVPVIIDGDAIHGHDLDNFINKTLVLFYEKQYTSESLELFRQLENTKKVVIIDDLDRARLNQRFKHRFVRDLSNVYINLVITANEAFELTDFIGSGESDNVDNPLKKFRRFGIMPFGHKLRFELINQWNSLGRIETIEDTELLAENDRLVSEINTVIGDNFVPPWPIIILILLQTMEGGLPHNLQESSYGYYYDLLISKSLLALNLKPDKINTLYNYITELAFMFYTRKVTKLSDYELRGFHEFYRTTYDISTYDIISNYETTLKMLLSSAVVEQTSDGFRFKYAYIYYYFVAKHLAANMSKSDEKEIISHLCSTLHVRENANVIMFLTHLSKDPNILDDILLQSKKIFSEFKPTELDRDISILNGLINTVPKMVLESTEVREHRKQRLIAKDELERGKTETSIGLATSLKEEDFIESDPLDIAAKLNSAFKTLQIIGQILKNYHGSIKGENKFELCVEAYHLGLRALNSFIVLMTEDIEPIINEIGNIIKDRNIEDKTEIDVLGRKFVFNLSCFITYQFIKRISISVGSTNLDETFKRVLSNENTPSVKLVDISIQLDHWRSIPFNHIKSIKILLSSNVLAYQVLRAMVLNHLYLFPTDYRDKQRICQLLDISVDTQRKIELRSTQYKQ